MSTGDGLAIIGAARGITGITWAMAWATVRSAAVRADALGKIGSAAWTAKTTRRAG